MVLRRDYRRHSPLAWPKWCCVLHRSGNYRHFCNRSPCGIETGRRVAHPDGSVGAIHRGGKHPFSRAASCFELAVDRDLVSSIGFRCQRGEPERVSPIILVSVANAVLDESARWLSAWPGADHPLWSWRGNRFWPFPRQFNSSLEPYQGEPIHCRFFFIVSGKFDQSVRLQALYAHIRIPDEPFLDGPHRGVPLAQFPRWRATMFCRAFADYPDCACECTGKAYFGEITSGCIRRL